MFALQKAGWLLVLDEWSPGAKINSYQDTTKKQNVLFHERFLFLKLCMLCTFVFIIFAGRKEDISSLVAKKEAFKYLHVCTMESIEKDEELLVPSFYAVSWSYACGRFRLHTGTLSGLKSPLRISLTHARPLITMSRNRNQRSYQAKMRREKRPCRARIRERKRTSGF